VGLKESLTRPVLHKRKQKEQAEAAHQISAGALYAQAINQAGKITGAVLVEIGPEGWTPTQQPPELTPFLRHFLRGSSFYFYLGE
jgi:hypothetical protein